MTNASPARNRLLLYVHGRDFKPAREHLEELVVEALRAGLQRDRADLVAAFDATTVELAYYGDISRQVLEARGRVYDEALDLVDRRNALDALKRLDKPKKFNLGRYDRLPGKTALKEFLADIGSPIARPLGLSAAIIRRLAPELGAYWDPNMPFRNETLARVTAPLRAALERGDDIAIVAHGIGSVAAWDALWTLSRGKAALGADAKLSLFVSMGSPLGDPTVKSRLLGARRRGPGRYPCNLLAWHNVAAEDDYFCYDKTLRDDYGTMLRNKLISRIQDVHIYNLAVRYGRSNPHSSVGYLVHPRMTGIMAAWLENSSRHDEPTEPASPAPAD